MNAARRTADVIVIGAGIHGASTALHLALRGLDVIVIEKDYAGRHSSGVNAGGVRQLARHVAEIPLSIASMELWERIESLVDDDCGFEAHGQVLVAETDEELAELRSRVDDLKMRGFTHEELIDATELRRLIPAVSDTCPGGIVSRRDGAADPFRTTQAFRRAAVKAGAAFHEGVAVTGLRREHGVWTVDTSRGVFTAPKVVNAAGAWADRIAAAVGEPVPLDVIAPMLMITSRVPAFIEPVVILRSRKLSFKQFPNGTVMIGGGHLGQTAPRRKCQHPRLDKIEGKRANGVGLVPGHAQLNNCPGLGGYRGAHARRYPGHRSEPYGRGPLSSVRLFSPRLPAWPGDGSDHGGTRRNRANKHAH